MLKSFNNNTYALEPALKALQTAGFDSPALSARALGSWIADLIETPCGVEVVESTGSTNDDLMQRARVQRPQHPTLLAADVQTAGRGRLRRPWLAAPRSSMLFSLAIPLMRLPAALPAVTLACGVGIGEYLRGRGIAVQLKWPNDIRVGGRKLCGILSEVAVDAEGAATLVVGVGLNGWLGDDDRAGISQPAAALADFFPATQIAAEREAWIGQVAGAVLASVERFMEEGFAPFRSRFNALIEARGNLVNIVDGGDTVVSGRLLEVDAIGRLLLETPTGQRAISVGDVSLRVAPCDS
jgi:BirA family biotin operon repressor/biotin-[acetyl-CoA-carboxylase] ligase